MDSDSLTTTEVARLCRVSDATVKRWATAGLIKSERTNGGHRRFRAEEIARFQNEQGLGTKQSVGDESVAKVGLRRGRGRKLSDCEFFHALLAGSENQASTILIRRLLEGETLTELLDGVVTESMHHIGELWQLGKVSVAEEHLASRTAICALHNLRASLPVPKPQNKLAICFTLEGDLHELATHCAQVTLESEGWEVWNFGANTPLFSISEEFDKHSPDLVCISSTLMNQIDRSSRDYVSFREKLENHRAKIAIGGQAFEEDDLSDRFPADYYLKTFSDVIKVATEIQTK
ncbi:MAG: helix-turn-helix domain-containing protein [Pyrinomonadaceae bacterium]|nr:helix-turn-helix domain-containing protein [Pyrinomonadaceae bacterium]